MRIGELSRRTGKTADALRYYEREGLLPNVSRDHRGHRIYGDGHILWLELLSRLRQTGMSITEIRRYAVLVESGDETLAERQAFLLAHRRRLEDRIRELNACAELIDAKVELYQSWIDAGGSPIRAPLEMDE